MMPEKPMRFHWSLSQAGDNLRASRERKDLTGLLNFQEQLDLCQKAEENGIDSMLMAIGFTRPDPLVLTVALGLQTTRIKFLVAVRSGLITPAYFVQQLNTASTIIGDRIHINIVSGHTPAELKYYGDFKVKDERNERTREFVKVCGAYWKNKKPVNFHGNYYSVENGMLKTPYNSPKGRPEIYISGNSPWAAKLVVSSGDCLWRFPDRPEALVHFIQTVLDAGKEVGLLTSIIARPTRGDAVKAASSLVENFVNSSKEIQNNNKKQYDSKGFREILEQATEGSHWLTPYLWNGAVPYMGPPSIALVGSYEEISDALFAYKQIGITQFLFIGWPDIEEIEHFGKGVLPLVRKREMEETLTDAKTM